MSNTQVGNVYQQIIADVIESSRVDFEEGGVDENVLEELRQGWQSKLSGLQVAQFPWDPKPEPAAIPNPPTVPSNVGQFMNQPQNVQSQPGLPMPQMPSNGDGPRVKSEPGINEMPMPGNQPQYQPQQPILNMPHATNAQQRAAAHLQQSYGQRAAASINAMQSAVQTNGPGPSVQQLQAIHQQRQIQQNAQRPQGQNPTSLTHEEYQKRMAQQAALQHQQAQRNAQSAQNGVGSAQTDGAVDDEVGDSSTVIKQLGSDGAETMGRIEIDGLIRRKIEAMGQSMEGGGLMLPLQELKKSSKRQRKVKKTSVGLSQNDGGDSDDDVKDEDGDEDAINSDLDDPDDGLNEDEDDDEGMGHIMLCMYDKVQRVKNKWKCVMKDGVLTVNGKEYVFHKATGDYEW